MAGIPTKEIKNRIRSMESTKQITKAMEMVAASKFRKAQEKVLNSRPYFESLHAVIHDIVDTTRDFSSPYLVSRAGNRAVYIVIAGDRGLAGGYNTNVLKLALSHMQGKDVKVIPLGKKALDFFNIRQIPLLTERFEEAEDVCVGDCFSLSKQLCRQYLNDEFDQLFVVYTNFVSALSQSPSILQLLPLTRRETDGKRSKESEMVYEPDEEAVFDAIVPEYVGGVVYGALCESRSSEHAARRTAMDSATQNADEMIADFSLQFNRARQASITQEITEIVAGS